MRLPDAAWQSLFWKIIWLTEMIVLVLAIAFILRFFNLATVPPAVDWDEASTAYNAYSILKTGRDEYGKSFPFLFRAFDGYVPPALIYLNVPSIKIFGLNALGARVPNATLGSLTVVGFYFLLFELTRRKNLASTGALLLAISPWHVTYSRVDFFATLPIFFVVFATYFLLRGLNKNKFLVLSSLFFVLAILSYFSAYVFVPLFVIALVFIYKEKLGLKRAFVFTAPIFLMTVFILIFSNGGQARFKGVSAFSDQDIIKESSEFARQDGLIGSVIDNRRIVYGQKFLEGYFASFRFDFLFGKVDQITRMVVPGAGFGLMLWWDLPFLLAGLYFLLNKKPNGWKVILIWLVLSPIAAAPTLPQMTSTRTTLMIPALVALTSYGFYFSIKSKGKLVKGILTLLLAFNFVIFANGYFRHFAHENSGKWFYGYRDLFTFLNRVENSSKKVYFVFKQPDILDQVYMFNLFYNRVDPAAWQKNGGTKLGCIATTGQVTLERYNFVPYACLEKPMGWSLVSDNDLVVVSKDLGVNPVDVVKFLNRDNAFYVYRYGNAKESLASEIKKKEL